MNKTTTRLLTCSCLTIFVLAVLLFTSTFTLSALWLRTYRAFTDKRLVAEIETTKVSKDEDGNPYFELTYKPIKDESALSRIFISQSEATDVDEDKTETFEIHGDRFQLGGELVKFNNWANILGFKTIYKVSRVKGEYQDLEKERNAPHSAYDLNGGVDNGWKFLEENSENLSLLVDTVYGDYPTQFARKKEQKWGLYITEDGFLIDVLE